MPLPAVALLFNAFVWGVSWWPFRLLQQQGLHPLWITALVYGVSVAVISAWRPSAWGELRRHPGLWMIALAAGTTNATFNWGVTVGDVVRVVLMFYLMPVWAVLLARWLLHEALDARALLRVGLALAGAAVVLWPRGGAGLAAGAPEALGLVGGFTFALNNVLLRRAHRRSGPSRSLAMFLGGAVVAGAAAAMLAAGGRVEWPAWPEARWIGLALGLALAFLASNHALQYGATRLSASATAVIMLTEVLFAALSAAWLGAARFTAPLLAGGALIVAAALLAAVSRAPAPPPSPPGG